jgi:hypothetical protein
VISDLLHLAALGATVYVLGPLLLLLILIAALYWLFRRPVR